MRIESWRTACSGPYAVNRKNPATAFIILATCLLLVSLLYAATYSRSIECKTIALFSTSKINRSELDGLRFNILTLISRDAFGDLNIQKNSLLINADDTSMTIASQVRISDPRGNRTAQTLVPRLDSTVDRIAHLYGFSVLNVSAKCIEPPGWHQLFTPSALLVALLAYLFKQRQRRLLEN